MKFKTKPYHLLLLAAIIMVIAGLLMPGDSVPGIHLHDTYIVLSSSYYTWCAVFLFLIWIIYLLTAKFLYSKRLTWAHVIVTVFCCLLIPALPYLLTSSYQGFAGMPRRYFDYSESGWFNVFGRFSKPMRVVFWFFVAVQLLYIINLGVGLFKRFQA